MNGDWRDYNGTEGGERLRRAEYASRHADGEEEGARTCAEPFRTLWMKWTSCSMVPTASLGRKYCSLDVLRMITEGTATSLGEGEEMQVYARSLG